MKATRELPAGYHPAGEIDLSKNPRLLFLVNAAGLVLLALAALLFTAVLGWLRPQDFARVFLVQVSNLVDVLVILVALLAITLVMAVVHEAIHGAFFHWMAGVKPIYGFRGMYAYAAAPGWHIPRGRYLPVGLAPLVIMSLAGVALMAVVPAAWLRWLYLLLIFNFSGAVGDLMIVGWLLFKPASTLVQDFGDGVRIFVPD